MTSVFIILLIYILGPVCSASDKGLRALEFTQKDSEDVKVNIQRDINVTEGLTVCLRAKSKYLNGSDLVFSNDTVLIHMREYNFPSIYLELGTKSFYVPWPSSKIRYAPLVWYTFCLAYTTSKQNVIFALNREVAMNYTFTDKLVFNLNPTNTLGFRDEYPFIGIITDYNIWNKPLTFLELQLFASCDTADVFGPNRDMALRWSNVVLLNNSKDVKTFKISYQEICSYEQNSNWLELIHSKLTQKEAIFLCSLFDGSMIYPKTKEDLDSIKALFNNSKHTVSCQECVWIHVKRSKEDEQKWIHNGTDEVTFLPWAEYQPNGMGLQDCIISTGNNRAYSDVECDQLFCSACKTRKFHYFNFRGKCAIDSRIDSKYVLFKNGNEEFVFQGFSGKSFIYGDSDTDTWKLVLGEPPNSVLVGTLKPYQIFPIGMHDWDIHGGYCDQMINSSTVPIKISQCEDDQFTCSNGICISMVKRCDVYFDCADRSDEENCVLLVKTTEEGNLIYDPPLTDRSLEGAQVNISLYLTYLGDFNVMKMVFTARFTLVLTWFDPRLKFHNLKNFSVNSNYLNKAELEEIWTPRLFISNAVDEAGLQMDEFASVVVLYQEGSKPNSPKELFENQVFSGSGNPFSYKRIYELQLHCDFDLHWFPFDYHNCFINFSLPYDLEKIVQLVPIKLEYNGPESLNQFKIFNQSMTEFDQGSAVQVRITLQRIFVFHLTNTYLPGLFLVVIAEITLFFKKSDLDIAMSLSLTIMLVVHTMYQSISQMLPQTAYIKFIDVFLIFGLLVPFSVFLLQVLSKVKQLNSKIEPKSKSMARKIAEKVSGSAKVSIPALSVIFLLCYVAVAFISYTSPQ